MYDSDNKIANTIMMLKNIQKKDDKKDDKKINVVFATYVNSAGINIFPKCHVIFTEKPSNLNLFLQAIGRSNRLDFNGVQHGT